jgi:hypothetical protein
VGVTESREHRYLTAQTYVDEIRCACRYEICCGWFKQLSYLSMAATAEDGGWNKAPWVCRERNGPRAADRVVLS